MRIIADSVNDMEQSLGCVVHLSLGCPGQTPYNIVPAFPWSTLSDTVFMRWRSYFCPSKWL